MTQAARFLFISFYLNYANNNFLMAFEKWQGIQLRASKRVQWEKVKVLG